MSFAFIHSVSDNVLQCATSSLIFTAELQSRWPFATKQDGDGKTKNNVYIIAFSTATSESKQRLVLCIIDLIDLPN
jgi:hypothetical protein